MLYILDFMFFLVYNLIMRKVEKLEYHFGKNIDISSHASSEDFHDFHWHADFYEVLYLTQGEMYHSFQGKKEVLLTTGDCVIVTPKSTHSFRGNGKYTKFDVLIKADFFDQACSLVPDFMELLEEQSETAIMRFTIEELEQVSIQVNNIITSSSKLRRALSLKFLFSIISKFLEERRAEQYSTCVTKIINQLSNPYYVKNIDQVFQSVNYSRSHLCHLFKKETGMTITEHVNNARLSLIKFYLTNSNMSLSEIAETVGFESLSYMHKLFYTQTGTTPLKYRKSRTQSV